jgi:hypothetical protein
MAGVSVARYCFTGWLVQPLLLSGCLAHPKNIARHLIFSFSFSKKFLLV